MPFEYDLRKSDSNRAKHGIDFEQAQALWNDEAHLEIPARNLDEPRFLVIGKIEGKHWSAVITYRRKNIRIISAVVRETRRLTCMKTKASDFDKKFDNGETIVEYLDLSQARRPAEEQRRINMEMAVWMLSALDREAKRIGISRQAIIKMWLAERLQAGQ